MDEDEREVEAQELLFRRQQRRGVDDLDKARSVCMDEAVSQAISEAGFHAQAVLKFEGLNDKCRGALPLFLINGSKATFDGALLGVKPIDDASGSAVEVHLYIVKGIIWTRGTSNETIQL